MDGACDRLHETGLIGSLRWWYEVLVRGLGGYACDPTSKMSCIYDPKKNAPPEEQICVACSLFGCTNWGRKFRLQTISPEKILIENKFINRNQDLHIQLIPLRPVEEEEWCLLQMTLRLISDYGALGGKTVFKPSDEQNRQTKFHHLDIGLVRIQTAGNWFCTKSLDEIQAYVGSEKKSKEDHDHPWASLQNFWCVKGRYLARQDDKTSAFNQALGRKELKNQARTLADNSKINRWLAGSQQESKKVFSFKHPTENGRTYGFVNPGLGLDFDMMKSRLQDVWPNFEPQEEFLTGDQVLTKLFPS